MAKGLKIRNSGGVVQIDSRFRALRLSYESDTEYWRQYGLITGSSNIIYLSRPAADQGYLVMISPKSYGWSMWRTRIVPDSASPATVLRMQWTMSSPSANFYYRVYQTDGAFIGSGTKGLRIRDPLGQEVFDSRRRYIRVRQQINLGAVNGFFPETYGQTLTFPQYEGRRVWFSFDSFGLCNVGGNAGGIFTNSRRATFDSATQITVTALRSMSANAQAIQFFGDAGPQPQPLLIAAD